LPARRPSSLGDGGLRSGIDEATKPHEKRPSTEPHSRADGTGRRETRDDLRADADEGGSIYIRYLPAGVEVGDPARKYLTVGTYPSARTRSARALQLPKATAKKTKATTFGLRDGGFAMVDKNRPTSVYVAFPGKDLQIEVYDPSPARARKSRRKSSKPSGS